MTVLAELRQGIVILRAKAFHAQATFQHGVWRARSALQWTFSFASTAIVMALLTAEVGFEESFRTFWVTLSRRQLPTARTSHALISSRPGASFTRQIALGALASVAIIPLSTGGPALSALKLQPVLAGGAVQPRHARLAGMQTRYADGSRRLHRRIIAVVALVNTALPLKQQRGLAGDAIAFGRTGAGLARGVARLAVRVFVILRGAAAIAMFGGAKTVLVQAPALDAARARRRGAGRASWGTLCTLSSLLVRAVTGWARRFTGAIEGE